MMSMPLFFNLSGQVQNREDFMVSNTKLYVGLSIFLAVIQKQTGAYFSSYSTTDLSIDFAYFSSYSTTDLRIDSAYFSKYYNGFYQLIKHVTCI
jgi:hypothetical protein